MAYVDDSGGTFIGNIGFGGVTPGFVIHAEKSVADKLAFFKNTNSAGYGVRFQTGTDLNYAIKVTNAAGTRDTVQIFGDGIIQVMPEPTFIGALAGGLRRDQGMRLYSGKNSDGYNEDCTIFMASNLGGANPDLGGSAHCGYFRQGADGGMRMEMNIYTRADTGATGSYETTRSQATWGFDSRGALSYLYKQPLSLGSSQWSSQAAQTLIINGAGGPGAGGAEIQYVDIFLMQAGRELGFGTCAAGQTNSPVRSLVIRSNHAIDCLERLAISASTTTRAGIRINPGVAPSTPANGDMWTTSAGLFVQINGVTKTVTLT